MRIAVYAFDGVTMFHLAVPQMVFDEVRRLGLGEWDCVLFADRAGPVRTAEGLRIEGVAGPEAAADADLVVVPSWHEDGRVPGAVLRRVLAEAQGRRAAIAGLCLGAIPLADAGLLAGRSAVTHWTAFGLLAERHPDLVLDETVLYIDHGDVLTAAGTASGLDACLHIVRTRLGSEAANRVARSLVVAPHREGGQAQYIERPVAAESASGTIGEVLEWAEAHLAEPLPIETLSARAHRSRRTFIREFRAATGTTPAAWIRSRRLNEARRLLETTGLPVERIADLCGFGSAVTLRQGFQAEYGTSPSRYRSRFRAGEQGE
ncbi:helix-turn-helix domain-containing protein [Herbiconiux sp.]|uniref:GlxA family transcriptional regulator n=1 Tax=Herbiconiux sp. TaxID=1871186 RepID=UPI0025B7F25D|nr:helix-turn-helix domain-containing protein [Herbiconiux sp.]